MTDLLLPPDNKLMAMRDRLADKSIAFVNGCFDGLHEGHLKCLAKAASISAFVVVAINTDAHIRENKKREPINNEATRVRLLKAQKNIIEVIVFNDNEPSRLIRILKPAYIVKGPDYRASLLPEQAAIESVGAQLVICTDVKKYQVHKFITICRSNKQIKPAQSTRVCSVCPCSQASAP